MGFRANTFAKIWKIQPLSDTSTKLQISISRKDKRTDEYVKEFSDFVVCVGSACASKAAKLHEGDTIKLGDVDVTSKWNAEQRRNYIDFKVFNFLTDDEARNGEAAPASSGKSQASKAKKQSALDEGIEANPIDCEDGDLPF